MPAARWRAAANMTTKRPLTEAEIADFLSPKIARYKMPKRFLFWEALPKSGYGKVPKRLVKDTLG